MERKNALSIEETQKIIHYLVKNGHILAIVAGDVCDVIDKVHPMINTLSMLTDGTIEKYQLQVSPEFADFVKEQHWQMPQLEAREIENLELNSRF